MSVPKRADPLGPGTEPLSTASPSRRQKVSASDWESWDDTRLLDLRMCDLDVSVEKSGLEDPIAQLYRELDARGIQFRPYFWLSDEWFTPDGVPGIAIPFYLSHPRLAKLELNQMLEVEGGTREWCMRILRHEAGHALENAYLLRRRRRRQKFFGTSSVPYPESYTVRPYSRSYVINLDSWYAQSHPDEDFAETFAVWLNPESDWQQRYAGWPALKKLQYVDELMKELAGRTPLVSSKRRIDPLSRLRKTLRQHYKRKLKHYGLDHPDFYDRDLRRLFSDAPEFASNLNAARFLSRIRKDVRRLVRRWTSERQYTIDQVLEGMIERCRTLNLHLTMPEDQARVEFGILLTVQTMNYLHSGRHRVAL
jgi:hypothetical protein